MLVFSASQAVYTYSGCCSGGIFRDQAQGGLVRRVRLSPSPINCPPETTSTKSPLGSGGA